MNCLPIPDAFIITNVPRAAPRLIIPFLQPAPRVIVLVLCRVPRLIVPVTGR